VLRDESLPSVIAREEAATNMPAPAMQAIMVLVFITSLLMFG
jgi:hypothetical protein